MYQYEYLTGLYCLDLALDQRIESSIGYELRTDVYMGTQ